MIFGIVGGRNFNNRKYLFDVLDGISKKIPIDMIVSGGANGADNLAYRYAVERGITFVCHPPLPEEPIPQRFHRRNLRIAEHCEILIAFPDKDSKGTYHTVGLVERLHKKALVFKYWETQ